MTAPKIHPQAHLFDGIDNDLINDFAIVRKAHNAPITATAIKGIKREAATAEMTLEDAITMCVENNWRGFRAAWALRITEQGKPARGSVNDDAKRILFGGRQ